MRPEMRICRARGKKPQPLKFLCSVVEQGQLLSEHLGRSSRETQTAGQQMPCLGVSVSALCVILVVLLRRGRMIGIDSPVQGAQYQPESWRWRSLEKRLLRMEP